MSDAPRRGRPPRYREQVFMTEDDREDVGISASGAGYPAPEGELAEQQPQDTPLTGLDPTWEPITDETPRAGADILVAYREFDDAGNLIRDDTRVVRWKMGRYFTGRRWQVGGAWIPTDGMVPLPAAPPTHWLKPAAPPEPEAEEAA